MHIQLCTSHKMMHAQPAAWNAKTETGMLFDERLKLHFTRQNVEIPLANYMHTGFGASSPQQLH